MSAEAWEHLQLLRDEIIDGSVVIPTTWSIDDIFYQADVDGVTLTREEALEALGDLPEVFDASVGTSWDTLSACIDNVVRARR